MICAETRICSEKSVVLLQFLSHHCQSRVLAHGGNVVYLWIHFKKIHLESVIMDCLKEISGNILSFNVIPSLEMLKCWQFKRLQTSDTVPVIPAILIFLQYMSHQITCNLAYLCVYSRRGRRQRWWTCKQQGCEAKCRSLRLRFRKSRHFKPVQDVFLTLIMWVLHLNLARP